MSENSFKPRGFQFTIRRLLLATLWAAAFTGAYAILRRIERHEVDVDEYDFAPVVILWVLMCISLPAAVGALFGRARQGAAIGLAAIFMFFAWIAYKLFSLH